MEFHLWWVEHISEEKRTQKCQAIQTAKHIHICSWFCYRHFVKRDLPITPRVYNSRISNVFHIPVAFSIPDVFFLLSFNEYLVGNLDKHLGKSNYFSIFPSCSHSILLRNRPLIFKICPKSILTHAQLFNWNQSLLVPILEPPSPGESDVLVNIGNGRFTVLHFVV